MTVKTGSAWAGSFVTLDATGAITAATGTPVGALYIDGAANAAAVTITGSNPYKWAVTLPALTAGQRVDMYITGTIATIATAGIVASEQADTALLSDGVAVASIATDAITAAALKADAVTKIQNGLATPTNITAGTITTVTNLTNLPAVTTDWLTAAGVQADAVTKIQSGLATATALAAAQADLDNPSQYKADVSGLMTAAAYTAPDNAGIAAIESKTNNLPTSPAPANEYDARMTAIQADLDNPAQYKADVSGLATAASLDAVDNFIDTEVAAILADTNEIQAELAAVKAETAAILDDTGTTGVLLSTSALGSIFDDEVIVGTYTFSDLLKIMAAALAGKATGGGTTSVTFRGVDDTSDVIVATVDANGNRSAVTLTV